MGNLVKLNERTGLAIKLYKKGQCYWSIKETYELKFKGLNNPTPQKMSQINFPEFEDYILFLI